MRTFFKNLLLFSVVLLFQPHNIYANSNGTLPLEGWRTTFYEKFNGNSLDQTKWSKTTGITHGANQSLEYFLPKEVSIKQGHLTITTHKQAYEGQLFTSGEIWTRRKFAQQYGRYEVRCRFPHNKGIWPAVYLLPADDKWPPEIDITEYIGVERKSVFFTNHWGTSEYDHQYWSEKFDSKTEDWSKWHVFTMEWSPNRIVWYVNGKLVYKHMRGVPQIPMYLRVNTAVGGNFARAPQETGWPQQFDVDYIRVYQYKGYPAPMYGPQYAFYVKADQQHKLEEQMRAKQAAAYSTPSPAVDVHSVNDDSHISSLWFIFIAFILAIMIGQMIGYGKHAIDIGFNVATLAAIGNYIIFRLNTINWDLWWLAIPLFSAEAFSLIHILGFNYTVWAGIEKSYLNNGDIIPKRLPEQTEPIFIFVPTVNESPSLLSKTIQGIISAKDKFLQESPKTIVRIVICNDHKAAGKPDWRDVEELADRLHVECITREKSGGAKAGNIEHARREIGATGDCYIVIFDADQVPTADFLIKTMPSFTDPQIGWVQTGQYYRNLQNPVARWANDQQQLFYRSICPGKAAQNANFICGTNFIIRAAALDEIGGFPQDCVTEDYEASVLLHGHWKSCYITEELATGLGPMDLTAYFAQQRRWATGTLTVFFRHWSTIFCGSPGGFTSEQRFQYILSSTNYFTGLRDFIFFITPIIFLLTGLSPFVNCDISQFLWRFIPLWFICQLGQWRVTGFKTSMRSQIMSFVSFPVLLISLFNVIFHRQSTFNVTSKVKSTKSAWYWLPVFASLMLTCLIVISTAYNIAPTDIGVLSAIVWLAGMMVSFGITIWIGNKSYWSDDREEITDIENVIHDDYFSNV